MDNVQRKTMSEIQVSANFRIPKGMMEEFKQYAAECLKCVKDNDDETIQHDWFLISIGLSVNALTNNLFQQYALL